VIPEWKFIPEIDVVGDKVPALSKIDTELVAFALSSKDT
jgi:hypothetical protein